MSEIFNSLKGMIPGALLIIIVVICFCIMNVEKLFLLQAAIYSCIARFSKKARRKTVASNLQGHVMRARKILKKENCDLLKEGITIEWVENEEKETFLQDNQVIIRMSHSEHPHKNLVTAVHSFVSTALLSNRREYINDAILCASDLVLSRKIISLANPDALYIFNSFLLDAFIKDDDEMEELIKKLCKIDENGMFVGIFINELNRATNMIYPSLNTTFKEESKAFLEYLFKIASKEGSSFSDFFFSHRYIKVNVVIVAKNETLGTRGVDPYINGINKAMHSGLNSIYVTGLGKKMELAEKIVDAIKLSNPSAHFSSGFKYRHLNPEYGISTTGVVYEIRVQDD